MLSKRHFMLLLVLIFGLTACRGKQSQALQESPPQVIKIGLPPALAYLEEPISTCADSNPTFDVLLLERNSLDWIKEPVDLAFTFQSAVPNTTNTYLIDEIEIVIIASKDLPINGLQLTDLEQIYRAVLVDPQQIGLPDDIALNIWGFEAGSDMAALFESQYHFSPQLPVEAYLAISPRSILEQISQSEHAVGYTLSPVINDQVKVLPIALDPPTPKIPIIASFKLPPSNIQEALIRCLQNPISE